MKRFHVHVAVSNLDQSVQFYSALFGQEPSIMQDDYAKWMLDDPYLNFALSKRTLVGKAGINHIGLQVHSSDELTEVQSRMTQATTRVMSEAAVDCCYAKSDKYWAKDPQGIAWEAFHSLETVKHYYGDEAEAQATGASLLNKSNNGCSTGCATARVRSWISRTLACCQ